MKYCTVGGDSSSTGRSGQKREKVCGITQSYYCLSQCSRHEHGTGTHLFRLTSCTCCVAGMLGDCQKRGGSVVHVDIFGALLERQ